MQLHVGTFQRCHWQSLGNGVFDDEGWAAYVKRMWHVHSILERGDLILDLWYDCGRPSPKARNEFTTQFASAHALDRIHGHAFVTNSALSRGVLTAVNWVVKRPFDEKLFASPSDAMPWLSKLNPALDARGLLIELNASIPGFSALKW